MWSAGEFPDTDVVEEVMDNFASRNASLRAAAHPVSPHEPSGVVQEPAEPEAAPAPAAIPVTATPAPAPIVLANPSAESDFYKWLLGIVVVAGAAAYIYSKRREKRENPDSNHQIVIAWMTTQRGRVPAQPAASMWNIEGGPADLKAANEYVKGLTKRGDSHARVFVYDPSERDPLERARREVIRSNPSDSLVRDALKRTDKKLVKVVDSYGNRNVGVFFYGTDTYITAVIDDGPLLSDVHRRGFRATQDWSTDVISKALNISSRHVRLGFGVDEFDVRSDDEFEKPERKRARR